MAAKTRPNVPMEYRIAFAERVRTARKSVSDKYKTVREFEKKLGLEPETYKHYENPKRATLLPHHLIEKFCQLTGFSSWYILTGKADSREPMSKDKVNNILDGELNTPGASVLSQDETKGKRKK